MTGRGQTCSSKAPALKFRLGSLLNSKRDRTKPSCSILASSGQECFRQEENYCLWRIGDACMKSCRIDDSHLQLKGTSLEVQIWQLVELEA